MIRQKNGADTLYTLHTSSSSGDLLLTNEELPRVASRRREVTQWVQKPFNVAVAKLLWARRKSPYCSQHLELADVLLALTKFVDKLLRYLHFEAGSLGS